MPAPATSSMGVNEDIDASDEIKCFRDEEGEDAGPCDRSEDVKPIVDHQERESNNQRHLAERNKAAAAERARVVQAEDYQHQAFVAAVQASASAKLYGLGSSSHFGYHHLVPGYGSFPTVHSPLAGMSIPKPTPLHPSPVTSPFFPSNFLRNATYPLHEYDYTHGANKMIASPLSSSPISSPFLATTGTPPPAHMGLSRSPFHPLYPGAGGMLPPDYNPWSSLWPQAGFRHSNSPYPTMAGSPFNYMRPMHGLGSPMGGMMPPFGFGLPHSPDHHAARFGHNGHSHHGEVSSSRVSHGDSSSTTSSNRDPSENHFGRSKKDKNSIKKPLNAFMLFMKEMRPIILQEGSLKESAAINTVLGKKWHSLPREEQQKYYEMAKVERENHARMYPGWTAKESYGQCGKKKRRKKEKTDEPKKCRAIFGIERMGEWCKPCKRKKKCTRYTQGGSMEPGNEDGMGRMDQNAMESVSSSMQALSPSGDSMASSSAGDMSPESVTASNC